MSNVVLIYPPGWIRISPMPPLGIGELRTSLLAHNIDVDIYDLEIMSYTSRINDEKDIDLRLLSEPLNIEKLFNTWKEPAILKTIEFCISMLSLEDAKLICFSIMGQRQLFSAMRLSLFLREMGYKTAVGGCYVSNNIDFIKIHDLFDFHFVNPSNSSFIELCVNLINRNNYRLKGKVFHDKQLQKTNFICSPSYTNKFLSYYPQAIKKMYSNNKDILIFQQRIDKGCKRSCSFCVRHSYDNYETADTEDFVNGLIAQNNAQNAKGFSLVTNAININTELTTELCKMIIDAKLPLSYYTYAVPYNINDQFAQLLFDSGCRILRFGVESGSDKILNNMRKEFTIKDAERAIEIAHKTGIWTQINLIIGYPNETESDINETIKFLEKNHKYIDSVRINPFYLQSGSDIHRNPMNYNIEIVEYNNTKVTFNELDGFNYLERKRNSVNAINRIYKVLNNYGIGYLGVIINLLMTAIIENDTKIKVKEWFNNEHPYFYDNYSFEALRWKVYHRNEMELNPFGENWNDYFGSTFEKRIN
jgi:radical SAM superfamily enzyme YgiQ (UPF0313 family)